MFILNQIQQIGKAMVLPWIKEKRDFYYPKAQVIPEDIRSELTPYFDKELLDKARIMVDPGIINEFSKLLGIPSGMLPSAAFGGIALIDTMVIADPRRVIAEYVFHELVHFVQYEKLGVEKFICIFIDGFVSGNYHNIPMEKQVFELQARFMRGENFKVFDEVRDYRFYSPKSSSLSAHIYSIAAFRLA